MLRTCDLIKWLHPYMNAARTWAAWYNTLLLIKLTLKVLSFLSFLKAATDVTQGQRPPAVPSQLRLRKAVWQAMVFVPRKCIYGTRPVSAHPWGAY